MEIKHKMVTARIAPELFKQFKLALAKKEENAQTVIERAISQYIKKVEADHARRS